MKKAGIVITVIGVIALITAIVFGMVVGGGGMKKLMDTPKIEISGGDGTTNLAAETEYRLFSRGEGTGFPECTISSPSGDEIDTEITATSVTLGEGEEAWFSKMKIVSKDEGEYSFSCDRDVMVANKEDVDKIGSGLLGIFGGIFGGIAALFLLLLGIILMLVGRQRERQRIRETVNFVDEFSQQGRPDHPGGPGAMGGPGTPGGPDAPGGQGRPASYWDQNPYGTQGPGPNQPPQR